MRILLRAPHIRNLLACCVSLLLICALHPTFAQSGAPVNRRSPADAASNELNRLLAAAQRAVENRDFETAAQDYQDYLAKKPDTAIVHYDLGYVYTALERHDDAIEEYRAAISLDPKMAPAYQNLGLELIPRDPRAAVEPLQMAVELMPADAHLKWLLGTAFERTGQPARAIAQFEAAQKLDEKDIEIRLSLGRALLASHRFAEAESSFRAALSLNLEGLSSKQARLGLANSLIAQKKLADGASAFAAYLELAPDDSAVRIERASALVDLGKNDDALAELDHAAAADPEGFRALKLRSQIYWELKRYDDAVPVLQKAAALAPKDPDISERLGRVYVAKKDYPHALPWLVAAYKLNPAANDLLAQVVEAEYLNKNYAEALAGLDSLYQREELPASSWYLRATCYDKLGRIPEALDAYQKFLGLNKDENSDMYFVSTSRVRVLTRELKEKKR
jgi:tetratricopeptide (TPR) repeat protein